MTRSENETQVTDGSASQASTLVPSAPPDPESQDSVVASHPTPSAPPQMDLLGEELDTSDVPTPKPRISEHRPLPKPPVQASHINEPKELDAKGDEDVTMT